MTIPVTCGSCQTEYLVNDRVAGKKVRCKSCGDTIKVPISDEDYLGGYDELEELDDEQEQDFSPANRPGKSTKNRGRKSKRLKPATGHSFVDFLGRQWVEAPVKVILFGIYGLGLLLGIVVPNVWLVEALILFSIVMTLISISILTAVGLQLWYNPWLIFAPFSPVYYSRPLTHDEARIPRVFFMWSVFVALFCIPPFFLAVVFAKDQLRPRRNRAAITRPRNSLAERQTGSSWSFI